MKKMMKSKLFIPVLIGLVLVGAYFFNEHRKKKSASVFNGGKTASEKGTVQEVKAGSSAPILVVSKPSTLAAKGAPGVAATTSTVFNKSTPLTVTANTTAQVLGGSQWVAQPQFASLN